jgi:hypothetical protein
MIGVPFQCHSNNLQLDFGMDTAEEYISYARAKFIKRLIDNAFTNEILKYTAENHIINSNADKYFDHLEVQREHRCMHKLIENVEDEIEKFKELRKVRKDKKSVVNDKVRTIRTLISQYETINFQEELFKIINLKSFKIKKQ